MTFFFFFLAVIASVVLPLNLGLLHHIYWSSRKPCGLSPPHPRPDFLSWCSYLVGDIFKLPGILVFQSPNKFINFKKWHC